MRTDLPLPERMRNLPTNKAGYVVPWFVAWIDGEPDFRVIRADGVGDAVRFSLCWLCGKPTGRYTSFVIGPMCAVNRVSGEPPSHPDCAEYAARVCPFLSNPNMRRRDVPEEVGAVDLPGTSIKRNPGVSLVWRTHAWSRFPADGGYLFDIGDPVDVSWWAHGRRATREEVTASIESGYPLLYDQAKTKGPGALDELRRCLDRAMLLLPEAA